MPRSFPRLCALSPGDNKPLANVRVTQLRVLVLGPPLQSPKQKSRKLYYVGVGSEVDTCGGDNYRWSDSLVIGLVVAKRVDAIIKVLALMSN